MEQMIARGCVLWATVLLSVKKSSWGFLSLSHSCRWKHPSGWAPTVPVALHVQVKHCPWQTLPPHGERWANSWLQQQVSAKCSLGSSSCYHGPQTQRILNLLEYLQKVKAAPNFSGTDSVGFTKMHSVPIHRQKGSCREELGHPNLFGSWICGSQTSGSQTSQNQIWPWFPWVKNSHLEKENGKSYSVYLLQKP